MTDPAEINLEQIVIRRYPSCHTSSIVLDDDFNSLIADVEALRERVAEMLDGEMKLSRRAEAAEAHVAELVGVLEQIIPVLDRTNTTGEIRHGHDKVERLVKAALAAMPTKEPAP